MNIQSQVQEFIFNIEEKSDKMFFVGLKNFINDLGTYPQVQKNVKLLLNGCLSKFQVSHLVSLGEGLAQLHNTYQLQISFGGIETFDLFLEGKYKIAYPKLKTLQINTKINDESFGAFCENLRTFIKNNTSTLKSFYLDFPSLCAVTSQSAISLGYCITQLKECESLQEFQLGLANWNVQSSFDESFPIICKGIQQIISKTNLQTFTINCAGWNVTDYSISSFSEAISNFRNKQSLKEININFTQIFRSKQSSLDALAAAFTAIFSSNKIVKLYLCLNGWRCQSLKELSKSFIHLKSLKKLYMHLKLKNYIVNQSPDSNEFMMNVLQLVKQNNYSKLHFNFPSIEDNKQDILREIEQIVIEKSNLHELQLNQIYIMQANKMGTYRKEMLWDTIKLLNKDQQFKQIITGDQRITFELN